MKLPFKRFIPHTLAFMLIASSPLSVLSSTAYANSLEQATQPQEILNNTSLQEPLQNEMGGDVAEQQPEEVTVQDPVPQPETPQTDLSPTPVETTNQIPNEVTSPSEVTDTPIQPAPPTSELETVEEDPPKEEEAEAEKPQPPVPTTLEERFQLTKQTMEKAQTYEEKRELVDDAFEAFKKDQRVEKLQLAMDYLVLLPYSDTDIYKGDKMYFASLLSDLIEFLPNSKEKVELFYHFADKSLKQTLITLNHNDLSIAELAHSLLPEGAKKDANKIQLDIAKKKVYEANSNPDSGYINWDDPSIEIGNPPAKDENSGNWEPGFDPDGYQPPSVPTPVPDNFQEGFTIINYTWENGTCYKNSTEYAQDGTFLKNIKDVADDSEKEFCSVEIPASNAKDIYGDGWEQDLIDNVGASPDSSLGADSELKNEKKAELNTNTIQYTFEKGIDSPYYYDTGIHVSKENTLTYQQSRDALYQIAVQAKGKFVEDKDRALALFDGLIILVEDDGKPIPVGEFTALFTETSIGVKAQSTRAGSTNALVDLIEIKKVSLVNVNDKKVVLEATPIVDNGHVLFPIDALVKSLNGSSSYTKDSMTVEYKGNRITFTDGQSSAVENGKEKKLTVPTRKNQDGIRMVDVKALLNFFQSTIEVESDMNEIVIKTK